jgi:cytochrome c oxidase subunit 2
MKFKAFASSLVLTLSIAVPLTAHHAQAETIQITAKRFEYTPNILNTKKGEPVTISMTAQDADHGLKFKDFNVNLSVKKGETKTVTFTPSQAGDFVGQCSTFCGSGHGHMKLTLHVTE